MRIIFSAGGTGGHLYPALALADYIKEHSDSRIYDGVSENDKYYHGAVLEIYNMVKVSTNQFKKK